MAKKKKQKKCQYCDQYVGITRVCYYCNRSIDKSVYLDPEAESINRFIEDQQNMATNLPTVVKKGSKAAVTNIPTAGYGYQGGGGHGNYTAYQACSHTGDKIIFEADGKAIYASSWQGMNEYSGKWDLIIDLAGNVKPPAPPGPWDKFIRAISTVGFAEELEPFVAVLPPKQLKSDLLSLQWPDMHIPPVGLDFWLMLWRKLPAKTVVLCQGGHGRTGSALAAFMITWGMDYWTAFETVRKEHCSKAIESLSQEIYLHRLYVARLQRDYALAVQEGQTDTAAELSEDLKYAEEHVPCAATAGGSKVYTPVQPTGGLLAGSTKWQDSSTDYMGEVMATEIRDGIVWQQRCAEMKCNKYKCTKADHLIWVSLASQTLDFSEMGEI